MVEPQSEAIYREVQRWSLTSRCLLMALCLLGVAGGVVSAVVILTRDTWQWASLPVVAFCGILIPMGVGLLIWVARLETEVRQDGLYIRYVPFHRRFRRFALQDLSEYHVRTYRPLVEYGGWGIRYGWKGRAYNVSGNRGVQLIFKDRRRLLVGSSRPSELEAAIRSIVREN
ncbi:MAG: hypothetical protein JW955_01550 [Sedimentisphaerales bacterium]|nr:hypothetical protein [Sedimentisphaerales bacterium]